jgi:hypothetical protein
MLEMKWDGQSIVLVALALRTLIAFVGLTTDVARLSDNRSMV